MTKENGTPQMTDERQFISERLVTYVEEHKADDEPLNLRVLAEEVGINHRYLQAILRGEHILARDSSIRDEYYEKVRDFLTQEHKRCLSPTCFTSSYTSIKITSHEPPTREINTQNLGAVAASGQRKCLVVEGAHGAAHHGR